MSNIINIFVGSDRSQLFPAKILKFSILKNTQNNISFKILNNIKIPEPKDIRQSQRTGFSFARWVIPEKCKFKGKAIYLDADMLVFKDIKSLWSINLRKAILAVCDKTQDDFISDNNSKNQNESSVMVINCSKANWKIKDLINGLDNNFTYTEMMKDICFLKKEEISRIIPGEWNSMDLWNKSVCLLHYTNTTTQPWVSTRNRFGYLWVDFVKELISKKKIKIKEVIREIELGYFRPSILREINGETCNDPYSDYAKELEKFDKKKKFKPHWEMQVWFKKRERAIFKYELNLTKKKSIIKYLKLLVLDQVKQLKAKMKSLIYDN